MTRNLLNYQSPMVEQRHRLSIRYPLVVVGGGIAGFLLWCLLDYLLIRHQMRELRAWQPDRFFPFLLLVIGIITFRRIGFWFATGLSLIAVIYACGITLGLTMLLGRRYHLWSHPSAAMYPNYLLDLLR